MQRREALRILMAGGVLPMLSTDLLACFQQAHPSLGYTLRTLSPHQNDTVIAMIDQILPATDTPGAKAARVNEFIDVILTEWATEDERQAFLDGLVSVDKQSNALFTKDFLVAAPDQQLVLLRSLDEEAAVARAKPKKPEVPFWEPEGRDRQLKNDFFTTFKNLTVHGYYTSEIGFSQELKFRIMPGAQHGCQPVGPGMSDADA